MTVHSCATVVKAVLLNAHSAVLFLLQFRAILHANKSQKKEQLYQQ